MACLCWFPHAAPQLGIEDVALFMCVIAIIGHKCMAMKHPQAANSMDAISRFFQNFAMQGLDGGFACVNPASRQLKFGVWILLERGQNAITCINNRIGPRAGAVILVWIWPIAKTAVHFIPS